MVTSQIDTCIRQTLNLIDCERFAGPLSNDDYYKMTNFLFE